MVDGLSRIQRLLQEQQWERSLSTSEEAIGDAHDDSPLSATVEGYSGGRVLLRFPGASNPIPGGRMLTSGAIGKGESVLIDQSPSAILDIEGMPWRRPPQPPQEEPVEPEIITYALFHLFAIVEGNFQSGTGSGYARTGKHYYLTDGTNLLKVFTSEPPLNLGPIMNEFVPATEARSVDWWAIDVNTIVIQFPTIDWSTYYVSDTNNDGSDIYTIGKQVVTVLIKDWAIALTDVQQSTVALEPIVYPEELQPYLNWLTPQHRISPRDVWDVIPPPIYDMVNATYGEGAFRLERGDNVGANMIPVQVQYKFREGDLLGDPINGYGADVEGDYFPFPPGAKVSALHRVESPLELNVFERAWTIATPTSSGEVVIPAVNFGGMSSDSVTYTDTLTLYDDPDRNPYTIGQIKSGAYNPESLGGSKIAGIFRSSPEFLNIGLVNQLMWLGSRAVLG